MTLQTPQDILWRLRRERGRPPSRGWRSRPGRDRGPVNGTYLRLVTSPDVRRDAFARFVARATDSARVNRGWSIPRIARESGVGVNTIYRWKRGEWTASPDADLVEKFCDALDIATDAAFNILWPGKTGRAMAPEPVPSDPDVETLLRQLNDPNVSESEKYLIRETIRSLAARAPRRRSA